MANRKGESTSPCLIPFDSLKYMETGDFLRKHEMLALHNYQQSIKYIISIQEPVSLN